MQIELNVNSTLQEETVRFDIKKLTPALNKIIDSLNNLDEKILIGYCENDVAILNPDEVVLFYTESRKVYCKTNDNSVYNIKERLYEIEETMKNHNFLRISNTLIINLKMVKKLNMDYGGSVRVILANGTTEFVSRRCLSNIKKYLGIGGNKK